MAKHENRKKIDGNWGTTLQGENKSLSSVYVLSITSFASSFHSDCAVTIRLSFSHRHHFAYYSPRVRICHHIKCFHSRGEENVNERRTKTEKSEAKKKAKIPLKWNKPIEL
jgi:hypothetical protein